MAEKPEPVKVLYCGVCGLPAEYCEFGPDFDKCKPWLILNAPQIYPHLIQEASGKEADNVADQLQSSSISAEMMKSLRGDTHEYGAEPLKLLNSNEGFKTVKTSDGSLTSQSEVVKRLPGGKVKKKDKKEVTIEKVVRNKRKCITTVKGLDNFGVKLSDASKKLGKKFATGASVVKGPTEKEHIDVQGDIAYDIVEFLTDTWPDVPESAIFFIEDGRKVPAA